MIRYQQFSRFFYFEKRDIIFGKIESSDENGNVYCLKMLQKNLNSQLCFLIITFQTKKYFCFNVSFHRDKQRALCNQSNVWIYVAAFFICSRIFVKFVYVWKMPLMPSVWWYPWSTFGSNWVILILLILFIHVCCTAHVQTECTISRVLAFIGKTHCQVYNNCRWKIPQVY